MVILASQSPRRQALLAQLGVEFTTFIADIDETPYRKEGSTEYVLRLALQKAQAGFDANIDTLASIGADTIVTVKEGEAETLLSKPVDFDDAQRMWTALGKAPHSVYTGVAIVTPEQTYSTVVETQVTFAKMIEAEMRWYWQTNEPQDKAGAYGIQGIAGQFIRHISGSYSNVVGLPLFETRDLIKQAGIKQYEC